jgi:hypothetical protein
MSDLTPGDSLRAIADHLDAHPRHGEVAVFIHGGSMNDTTDLDIILDGATAADIGLTGVQGLSVVNVTRDFGPVTLFAVVPRRLVAERRPTVAEQVLTTTQLLARRNQQALEVQT